MRIRESKLEGLDESRESEKLREHKKLEVYYTYNKLTIMEVLGKQRPTRKNG